ncbi:MAG: hypothetical protein KKG59_05465, partial [Nanoarchaeota archaeon]|nr:hypothetical protein [Nanoarchaeota archaeon]
LKRENNVKSEQEEQNARIENALTPIIYMYIGPKRFTFSSDHNLEEFECSNIVEAAEIYKGLDFINTALDILMKDDLTNPYLEKHPNIKKSFSHGMMKRVFALGEKTGYVSTMDFWKNFLEYSIRDKSVGGYLFKLREEKRRSDNVPEGVLEAVRDDSGLMQKLEEKLKKDIEKGHIRDIEYIEELSDGKFKVTREERIGMGDMNAQKKKWSEAMECYPDGEYGKFADTYKSEIQERIRTKSEFESEHDLFDLNRDFLKLAIYRLFAGQGEQLEKTIVNHELVFDPVTQVEVLKGIYSGITGAENEYERALGENTPKDFFNQLESAKIKCETVIRVVADELAINQDYESAKNLYNVIGDQEKVKAIGEIEKFWKSKEEDIFKDIPKEERLKVKILYATEPLL